MDKVEFDGVGYSIFDGEVFSEEDYDSLEEQGEFDADGDDNPFKDYNEMMAMFESVQKKPKPTPPTIPTNRKSKRKLSAQSRKNNRSK
jgi:hypothetical protein